MKLSDNYTRQDLLDINFMTFMVSMIMLALAIIAWIGGLL